MELLNRPENRRLGTLVRDARYCINAARYRPLQGHKGSAKAPRRPYRSGGGDLGFTPGAPLR